MGRSAELDELSRAIRQPTRDRPGIALFTVTGDPGIGKTALLDEFARHADAQDTMTVLTGTATRNIDDERGVLADALDSGGDPAPGARAVIEDLTSDGTLVLLVDDCHLATPEALAPLADLLRKPPCSPVVVVVAFRDREARAHLHTVLSSGSSRVAVTDLPLAPLSEQDVNLMLADLGIPAWRSKLYQECGGNPGYLDVLLSAGQPGSYRQAHDAAVAAQLNGVGRATGHTANAAAVIGDEFDVDLLAAVMAEPEATVLAAVDELLVRDLVRPGECGRRFRFRHPMVRRVIYERCASSARMYLHRRTDAALRERGASPVQLAPHVQQDIRHGEVAKVPLLVEAADTIVATDPETAIDWLRTALRVLPEEHRCQPELLMRLAKSLGTSGQLRECWETLHSALRLLPGDQDRMRAEGLSVIAAVERMLGIHGSADPLLRKEVETATQHEVGLAAILRLEVAHNDLARGEHQACRDSARSALDTLRGHEPEHRPLVASCLGLISKAEGTGGDPDSSRRRLSEAATILDSLLDDELAANLDAGLWVGWTEITLHNWCDAARHFDKAVDLAVRTNNGLMLPNLLFGYVMALRNRGRLADAQAAARYAVYLAKHAGNKKQLFGAAAMLLWADAHLGRQDETTAITAEAFIRDDLSGWQDMIALRMVAEARVLCDDPEGALHTLSYAGGPELTKVGNGVSYVGWAEVMARAEIAVGRTDAARGWAASAADVADRLAHRGSIGLAALAMANVTLASDPAAALPDAERATRRLAETGTILDEARARTALGVALWHNGLNSQAVRELRSVEAGYHRIGAVGLAKAANRERRRVNALGHHGQENRPPDEPAAALSKREHEIAQLVRDGLTNRQISRTLFIAEKTVEMHLTKLFSKLGVGNRAGVAAYLERSRVD